jgi:hypothetical protein
MNPGVFLLVACLLALAYALGDRIGWRGGAVNAIDGLRARCTAREWAAVAAILGREGCPDGRECGCAECEPFPSPPSVKEFTPVGEAPG